MPREMPDSPRHPVTPDGRYLVVRGRLWRTANPNLDQHERRQLVSDLMDARRRVQATKRAGDLDGESAARRDVDAAKRGLGERGPVWWTDGAPDLNRRMVTSTPYATWYAGIVAAQADPFPP